MKLTLTSDELKALFFAIQNHAKDVTFNTTYESKLTGQIMKVFMMKLAKLRVDNRPKYSIAVDPVTMLALNFTLPQIYPDNDFSKSVILSIYQKVNQACLSI